jgi:hypothetical protein
MEINKVKFIINTVLLLMFSSSAFAESKCLRVVGHVKKLNCYREVRAELQFEVEGLESKCSEKGNHVTSGDFNDLDSTIDSVKKEMVHYPPGGLFRYRPIKKNQMDEAAYWLSRLQDHLDSIKWFCHQ